MVWEIEGAVRQKPMPSLVLQPLVENAVYHGISRLPDGGLVTVQVELAGDSVRASVENPVPDDAGRADGHHMALSNIEQRLHALYGGEGRLQAGRSGGLFRVELQYPAEQPL